MTRKNARENAFILLFELECRKDESPIEIFEYSKEFETFEADDYVKKVFFGVQERRKEIDELIEANSIGWKKNRISAVSMAVISLAVYEMLAVDDVPCKVAINEAIEISKKYDEEKAYVFVNGILNKIAEALELK